jgi:hypothetical protein
MVEDTEETVSFALWTKTIADSKWGVLLTDGYFPIVHEPCISKFCCKGSKGETW